MNEHRAGDSASVRIPPPFIYIAGLLIGIYGGRLLPGTLPEPAWVLAAASVLFAAGFVLALSAIMRFRSLGTQLRPDKPVTALVFDGPYRFTRNPMYVGLAMVYIGIALWVASLWALVLLVPVLLIIRYAVIAREERYLVSKFGPAYLAYTSRVRRWL